MEEKHIIAVYGTLRQGFGNHRIINDKPFHKTELTNFVMYSLGGFPAIVESNDDKDTIAVELYEVDDITLANVDSLEGYNRESDHNPFYDCKEVEVYLGDGNYTTASIYVMHENSRYIKGAPVVKSGDWVKHTKTSRWMSL